jgi:YHS domain-containing protein
MELGLIIESQSPSALQASYSCPCGCHPEVTYIRAASPATDTCCCGNEFAIGAGAEDRITQRVGFEQQNAAFEAPWGESLSAVWAIGPSTHADHHISDHPEHHVSGPEAAVFDERLVGAIDPVCGMAIEPEAARTNGLRSSYRGRDYFFCGKGCKLDFDDDSEHFLDTDYVPGM